MDSRDVTTVLLVILGALILLPVLGMSMWGFGMMGPGMMGPGMMGPGAWGGWFGGFGVLALLLLIGGVVLVVLALARSKPGAEPMEVLKRRLARGEITREQYEQLRQALQ